MTPKDCFRLMHALIIAGALLFQASCTTIRAHSDFDPEVKFEEYQTYAWLSDDDLVHSQSVGDRTISALNLQRIKQAIETNLADKEFQQIIEKDHADFWVSFTVGTRDKVDVDRYPLVYRGRWIRHWPYAWEAADVHAYTEGTLAIDIFDRVSNRPAWHGVARKRIMDSDKDHANELIQKAVAAILAEFPPP